MRTNFQTWLNSLTNDDGSGTTGDLLSVAWFTDQMDVIGGDMDVMEADIDALQAAGFLTNYDSVLYVYKDANTITIQAGGQFVASDNSKMFTVAANTDLPLSTGLTTGQTEAANTLYYVWGGEDSNSATRFYFSNSATVMPSELVKGKLLRGAIRNDNSSNIIEFRMTQRQYLYVADITGNGSDATEVLDTTVATSFVDVTCSEFLPPGRRGVSLLYRNGTNPISAYWRDKDSSLSMGVQFKGTAGDLVVSFVAIVNASGVFQVRNGNSATTRATLIAYEL